MSETMSNFWRVTFGNVLTILAMGAAVLTFFLTYDHQIRDNQNNLASHIRDHEAEKAAHSNAELIVHDRLRALEAGQALISPQLARIDEKLSWIQDWIKEQKAAKLAKP